MKATGKVWMFFDSETKKQTQPLSTTQAQMTILSFKTTEVEKNFLWTPGWDDWKPLKDFLESEQKYFVLIHPPKPEIAHEKYNIPHPPQINEELNTKSNSNIIEDSQSNITIVEWTSEGNKPQKNETIGLGHDFNGNDLSLSGVPNVKPLKEVKKHKKNNSDERRKETRTNCKIEVIVMSPTKSFRTFSKNISLTGTLLAKPLPIDMQKETLELVFINLLEPNPKFSKLHFKAKIIGDIVDPRRLQFEEKDPEMTKKLKALLLSFETNKASA